MFNKLKRAFGFGTCDPKEGTTIVINSEKLERRVALLENGILEEYNIEREGHDNIVGGIFKGRVKNIEPGLKAMFVDIGYEKNAFLHFWDALPAALDSSLEEIEREGRPKKQQRKITSKDIPEIYPIGSEIMVQVTKGPISSKGPRVTTNISLAGRYIVLMPYTDQFGISRKIDDPKERQRLRQIVQKLNVPEGMGIIMRTVAQGQRFRHFVRDLAMLLEQWRAVEEKRDSRPAPVSVYREPDLIERTARDFLTDNVDNIICDNLETTQMMQDIAGKISRRSKRHIQHFQTRNPIFEELGIQKQINEAFQRQVLLPCGGYLVIDETEALIAIDVNTGRNKGSKDLDKTILETNLESAREIARQLRLRNIGGLVVVDFIDMRHRKDQLSVYKMMKDCLKRDKAKTQVLQISPIGLMEMTRQRLNESLRDYVNDHCPYCHGRGRIKSVVTMSVEIQRQIHATLKKYSDTVGDLVVVVNSEVLSRFKNEDAALLMELERQCNGRLLFRSDPSIHREAFAILDARNDSKPLYQVNM
ncbi:Rne/Rng family ribonuclease [Akkermansia glycaniphila]|uniref:Ribonuclease G n=1 Tax=Akkermansia glycaniphila TaxID=1679444 RepID=A0A1C7PD10_9BACT|nr:Rne/Rng family ribonuclease [Akkermansia glycaniphila]MBT9450708.1 Rne/Rng family ribonuclease [Akkermansia glycaniphila]OCA02471.1 ribonuclease [Akkermansia glycaniphila]OCA03451.1 ribonuclease [Akkermansia glycaniphila]SEH90368.1 rnaseeg: ribonuclease rne/rng family [Akkermansia glycaniphila]